MTVETTRLQYNDYCYVADNKLITTTSGKSEDANKPTELVAGYTALHWAVENGDIQAVRLLLNAGANPNCGASFDDHSGVHPLHLAAQDGYAEIADELLRHKAHRDPRKRTKNRDNVTPLHQAAYNGHPAAVDVLVRAGCDVNVQADNGFAAIHYAAQRGSVEITQSILAANNRQQTVNLGLLVSVKDQTDITPLHLAVQSGNADVITALIKAGAPIDAGKKTAGGIGGVTPLHQAVYQLREDIVDILLQLGADPNRSMNGWYTPLHVAAEKSSASIATRLIEAGALVDSRAAVGDHGDMTALHVAAQHGHLSVVRVLAQNGADLFATRRFADRSRITALHLATENGFVETVQVLLELTKTKTIAPADTSASSSMSAANGRPSKSSFLAFVNSQDSFGFTALHLAVQYQFIDVVRALIAAEADLTIRTATGLTATKIANHLPSVIIRDLLRVEASSTMSASRNTSLTSQSSKSDRHHHHKSGNHKSGKLRSLLCGANKR